MRRRFSKVALWTLTAVFLLPWLSLILPRSTVAGILQAIIPAAVPVANKLGNSSKFQLGTGVPISGDCVKYDSNGNVTDAGFSCPTGGVSAPCFLASALGLAVDDTDQTAALNALVTTTNYPNGLCIAIDPGGRFRIGSSQYIPWGGGALTDSVEGVVPALRFTSACPQQSTGLYMDHPFPPDCASLDLRFASSGDSRYNQGPKILAAGRGILEIDHLTIGDWGTDSAAYILATGSSLRIHDNTFRGSFTFASSTSFTIGTGSKAFTVASGESLTGTPTVFIQSHANQNNWMWGTLTSYSGTTLTVNVTIVHGSGTLADWDIRVSGASHSDMPIVLGGFPGTSCCAGTTADAFAGYDTIIRDNMFEDFQRCIELQPLANAIVIQNNHFRGGNTVSPGDIIEAAGGNSVTIDSVIITGNLFEMSSVSSAGKDYAEAILLQGSQHFQIYGNSVFDGDGTTCMVLPNGAHVINNNIRQNAFAQAGNQICSAMDNSNHLDLTGVTSSIGGGALLAGACASTTLTLTGVSAGMALAVTPTTYPGDGNYWLGYVSADNTVTVKVCAAIAGTPTTSTYRVVMQ